MTLAVNDTIFLPDWRNCYPFEDLRMGQHIAIDPAVYTVLKERADELSEPLPEIIRRACISGLTYEAWGER